MSLTFNGKVQILLWTQLGVGGETSRGEGVRYLLPFFEKWKKSALILGKKCPDCVHLCWIFNLKFYFKILFKKTPKFFLAPFVWALWIKSLSKSPYSKKPETFLFAPLGLICQLDIISSEA